MRAATKTKERVRNDAPFLHMRARPELLIDIKVICKHFSVPTKTDAVHIAVRRLADAIKNGAT